MKLTRPDEKYLSGLAIRCRPDWDEGGVVMALRKAGDHTKPPDFATYAQALTAYANAKTETGAYRWATPGYFHMQGPHWDNTPIADRPVPSMCDQHPDVPATKCRTCNRDERPEITVDWRAEYHATKAQHAPLTRQALTGKAST